MSKLLVICGCTASGKSTLAVECAKLLNGEIISADSQLVYRGLNIGTAKPTVAEMQGVIHHLVDIVSAEESFSVSDYEARAVPIVERLLKEGKTPILCGGTGFYINSVLYKLGYGNAKANPLVRAKYEAMLSERGKDYLYEELKKVDKETAEKLSPNDVKRVIRALEIYEVSGRPKSAQDDKLTPRFDFKAVSIDYPRDELYNRINCRVDVMFNSGLIEEVKGLLKRGIDERYQCMQAIGYKEVLEGLKNGTNESTMRDIIKQNTRRYAKRQITFFKRMENLTKLKPDKANAKYVAELLND